MIRILVILAVAISALKPSLLFSGEQQPQYAKVGVWDIRIDTTLNNGCFALAEYDGGTVLRLGINNKVGEEGMYALFGDPNWKSIEYGKEYAVQIQFGNETKWSGDARGISFDPPENQPYLWVAINNDEDVSVTFISEFMEELWVELFYNDSSIASLKLKGSYAAGLKLIECQKEQNKELKDPFATPAKTQDPFKA